MAGGPMGVPLALAVAEAGAFPVLAGGYTAAAALAGDLRALRASGRAFGVNLFVPDPDAASLDREGFAAYARELAPEAARYGIELQAEPVLDDDGWGEKLALLLAEPVPLVSLTFGLPAPEDVARLQAVGTRVLASVTSPEEAIAAREAGVDGLVVQGPAAGGHRASLDPRRAPEPGSTPELVRRIRAAVDLPLVAGGGVDGPDAVAAILEAGAEAVAVGTLLLLAEEAGTSPTHRAALEDPAFTETVVTRAFTGRPARALRNRFAEEHGGTAPHAYPAVHHLTRALRAAAGAAGDAQTLHLWAGEGWRSARRAPAGEILGWLARALAG
ncbi:nitronate monooxygenase [Homoserinibacter sp. YIM 151385]|nr:nitronate monooxygenase [Homoserinibacter sp. YIM 151385]WBU39404.1 nitronate monooxygenase [Homoserinibacter sp. YIM 151385]